MRPRSNRARRTSCAWSGTRSASSENSYSEEAERVPDQAQLVHRALLERGLIGTPEAEQAALALVGHLNDETSGGLVLGYDGRVNSAAAHSETGHQKPIPRAIDLLPIAGAQDRVR